ncbi:MAG: nucleotidyltransferase domain-containing protein [Acidobacteriota bacterium]
MAAAVYRALPLPAPPTAAAAVVERAASLFGGALVGVAVFGSWARDELDEDSDVDLLVVVDDRVRITRQRYRHWDRSPLYWGGRIVVPHVAGAEARADSRSDA